jgi:hypothetical protein
MSVLDPALGGKVYGKVVFVPLKFCPTDNGVGEERRAIPHGELVCVCVCDRLVAVLWTVMSVKGRYFSGVFYRAERMDGRTFFDVRHLALGP